MAQPERLISPGKVMSLAMSVRSLRAYFLVTKPAMVALLVFTGVVGFARASHGTFPAEPFLFLLLALTLGCAAANTLTGYIDRDIDAVMVRTRYRPIPSSQLSPGRALVFGLVLALLALGFSLRLNWLTFALIFLGLINNVVMYSLWAKRRTPLNIFAGSLAGGLPAVSGYAAYAGGIGPDGLWLGAIVMIWIPVHVWSIAIKYRADYAEAGVPMLPVIISRERAVQFIALATGLLVVLSVIPALLGLFGWVYLLSAVSLGVVLLFLSLWLMFRPLERHAWILFKVSGVYLGLLFLAVLVDAVLGA
ncbi:MAG TPA: protoheme IX farnesyltransferase [Dehalococcoidia bacterium]|jgi:protoheme IX farnesyltransferase|nr:protoheme IX farnesyltransferase [Dehalococcoidia bacterium]